MADIQKSISDALDALCEVAFALPQESKTRQQCVNAERGLRDALNAIAVERIPYAWEVCQGGRTFLLSAQEFTGKSYDCASFKPLYQ